MIEGWYRHCGIIPFTNDADIGLWEHEYDETISKTFLGDKYVPLNVIFGLKNDSYELRLRNYSLQIDLFVVYKHNSTHQKCGYQLGRRKFT